MNRPDKHIIRVDEKTYESFLKFHLNLQAILFKKLTQNDVVAYLLKENEMLKSTIKSLKKESKKKSKKPKK